MNKVLLILFMLFSLSSIAKDTDTVSSDKSIIQKGADKVNEAVQYTDTSSLFKTMYGDMKTGITALAKSLKVGAEHVYMVLIRQQIVESITWLSIACLFIFAPFLWFNKLYRLAKDSVKTNEEGPILSFIFAAVVPVGIGILILVINMNTIVTGFVNPEYGAMQDIVKMAQSFK